MIHQRERVTFKQGSVSPGKVATGLSRNSKIVVRGRLSGSEMLQHLQRSHGNAYVQRLIKLKLSVGQPGDESEQEVHRVTDAIVRKSDHNIATHEIARYARRSVHRICTECAGEMEHQAVDENEDEEKLQRQMALGRATAASGETEAGLGALRGGGTPSSASVRADFALHPSDDFKRVHANMGSHAAHLARSVGALTLADGGDIVFAAERYWPATSDGKGLSGHAPTELAQRGNHASYATIQRQEPEETQTALQKLDADLASEWTLDRTIQTDLKALSQKEKEVVLSGTSYRDKLVERLSESGLLQALATLGADLDTTLNWLEAEGIKHFKLTYGSDYKRSTPDGTLDAELERRMLAMCEFLILNDMVTANISLNWAARSRAEAHIKSTAYHIIKGYVTLDDLKKLLADPAKDKENRTHTARAGDSLSLIAGYPNAGWRDRLDQLIAANSELPSIRDRSPDDPRYAWLDIGDVINIPWATPGDGDAGAQPLREVRDGDENLWYVEDWNKAETDEQARKNRGIGKGEKLSLAYEGYEVGEPKRLPNSLDPTHPPVSAHVHGLAIDATILWIKSTKLPPWAPGWSISQILDHFKLQRPIMEDNPYGPAEAEPWHFEKL